MFFVLDYFAVVHRNMKEYESPKDKYNRYGYEEAYYSLLARARVSLNNKSGPS